MDKRKYKVVVFAGLSMLVVSMSSGCSGIGNAPAGPSVQQIKASFDAKPLEERVKAIREASIPEGIKQQTIKKMYEKEGKTPPADVLNTAGGHRPVTGH